MVWLARAVYRFLVWRERSRTRKGGRRQRSTSPAAGRRLEQSEAAHLETGRRGELLAYWYLRQAGYTIVARNRRSGIAREHQRGPIPGELDLVAWDGPVLAFVEVKTRASADGQPDARLVRDAQRRRIARAAAGYLRRLKRAGKVTYRFDVVVVAWSADAGYSVRLVKDAYKASILGQRVTC
jgi:putative endonuclease